MTDVKTLYEFTEKLSDTENAYPSYEQDNFDLSFDVWLGVFDQLVYKFNFDFTTQESSIGSIQFDSSITFKYQDPSIDIPNDSECVSNICDAAIGDISFMQELCQNSFYRDMFDSLSVDLKDDQLNNSAQARDTQRKSDLRTIQTALESYNDENGKYPISTEISKTSDKNGIIYQALIEISEKVPVDPNNPDWYYAYKTNTDGTAYELTCLLEVPSNPEDYEKIGTGYLYKVGTDSV
ncbi:MAG: type II secretion system protein GspG [bacterium]